MTLREKFGEATNKGIYYVIPIIEDAEIIEQIADDFAVGFAEWVLREQFVLGFNSDQSIKELLQIYKKEKGL
jgi:hypothetical protein